MTSSADTSPDPADLGVYAARLVRRIRRDLELPTWARLLSILDEEGPSSITVLARTDSCSQPTMSAQVIQLVAAGLVSKESNPADARGSVVMLTDAGRAELSRIRDRIGAALGDQLSASGHTEADLRVAVSVHGDLVGRH